MFGISGFELLIIVALVLIIFGPDKLPELGRTIGRAMGMFKRAQEDMERVIRAEMYSDPSKGSKPSTQDVSGGEPAGEAAAPQGIATTIWSATDEDDEEEDEE